MLLHPRQVCWTDRWTDRSVGRCSGGSESKQLTSLKLAWCWGWFLLFPPGGLGKCLPVVEPC